MANLFDYIAWRGDLDFDASPLNSVDYLIFSQMSYLPFEGLVPAPGEKNGIRMDLALENLLEKLYTSEEGSGPLLSFKEEPELINALMSSERFKKCRLFGYVNKIDIEKELQFAALCIYTGKDSFIVVFRGTDLSFVGWKEDFNMSFREVIPAQQEAVKYLEEMANTLEGKITVIGHSKGGNLAVYASAFCNNKVQERIMDIYSYDAPGFQKKVISSDCYIRIKNRIHSYIPQGSIIGMVLEHGCDYKVVKSKQIGLFQHLLFSWEVTFNNLVHLEDINLSSRYLDKTIRGWINSLDNNQREQFVEAVYKVITSSEAKSVHEMENTWLLSLGRILKSIGTTDESTRKNTFKTFANFIRSAGRNLDTFIKWHESES